jgi:hypothetical protein
MNSQKLLNDYGFGCFATTVPGLKPRQGVFPSGLQTFSYHLGNMHKLAPKMREDTTLQT